MCHPLPGRTTCVHSNTELILWAVLPPPSGRESMSCMGLRLTDWGIEWVPAVADLEPNELAARLAPWFEDYGLQQIDYFVNYTRGGSPGTCTRRCNCGGLGLPPPLYGATRSQPLVGQGDKDDDESWMGVGHPAHPDHAGPTNNSGNKIPVKKKIKRAGTKKRTRP
ncbi:uncharacterized protein LOC62_07G009467 [Vanrija pseudolonga]|uniref:Uncharacterized protein n=1 Tax=Vanrija pseudolonga TaxID=143232 RepID=A0AAF1BRK8_9TREE|nr:hypothetical protein LOC62_07G009467 [Vanrija pseudolonga]